MVRGSGRGSRDLTYRVAVHSGGGEATDRTVRACSDVRNSARLSQVLSMRSSGGSEVGCGACRGLGTSTEMARRLGDGARDGAGRQ
jgi:hypothetical protein